MGLAAFPALSAGIGLKAVAAVVVMTLILGWKATFMLLSAAILAAIVICLALWVITAITRS